MVCNLLLSWFAICYCPGLQSVIVMVCSLLLSWFAVLLLSWFAVLLLSWFAVRIICLFRCCRAGGDNAVGGVDGNVGC